MENTVEFEPLEVAEGGKRSLSWRAWLSKLKVLKSPPLIIGVFIIIYVGFGMVYFQKQAEAESLESTIALQEVVAAKPVLAYGIEEKQAALAAANLELENALTLSEEYRALLPSSEMAIDVYDEILEWGAAIDARFSSLGSGAEITRIGVTGPTAGSDGSKILACSLQMQGSLSALLQFIEELIESDELLIGMELTGIKIGSNADSSNLDLAFTVQTWPEEE